MTFVLTACENDLKVPYFSTDIEYMGRVDVSGSSAKLMWPGSSAKITFEGSEVYAEMDDKNGKNYYNVIVDDDSVFILHPDTGKRKYLLAKGLGEGKHTVELFKRTEWPNGTTHFYGFEIKGDAGIFPPLRKKDLKLEFYGNSITAGYAVEDYSGNDSPDSIYTNNYYSYAAVTARTLNAEYSCIARGGIGIMISWYPMIMPEMYDRLDPSDPESKWDFSLYTPDIVVINLFQNDSWLVNKPDFPEFKHRFGTTPPSEKFIVEAYKKFVTDIRSKYPAAKIICMLGNMDITRDGSPWPGYVARAVEELKDENIYPLFVPYKDTPGHPKVEEQQVLADALVEKIKEIN